MQIISPLQAERSQTTSCSAERRLSEVSITRVIAGCRRFFSCERYALNRNTTRAPALGPRVCRMARPYRRGPGSPPGSLGPLRVWAAVRSERSALT
jgi:hypothetical protein